MEFLEKLYSQEYFAPVLFTIIAILAVLFVIVLILALRDAKKKKGNVEANTTDAFAKTEDEIQEINVNVSNANEVKEENKEESVISSVEPTNNGFEDVAVEAPVAENNEIPIVNENNSEANVEPTFEPVSPVAPVEEQNEIKIEPEAEVSSNDVEKAESDLDAIAATLLSEYQKDGEAKEEDKVETPSVQPDQFSAVGVTPNTLPNVEEEETSVPNLNDIPTPQPVRVTDTSTVIDSSKANVDNIPTEEYNINK